MAEWSKASSTLLGYWGRKLLGGSNPFSLRQEKSEKRPAQGVGDSETSVIPSLSASWTCSQPKTIAFFVQQG